MNKGISVFLSVYNEENRIYYTLQSLLWCDEVIVQDKHSSDRTVEIAKSFPNVRVFQIDNSDFFSASENNIFFENCRYQYSMFVTASDIIHPALAYEIKRLVHDDSFTYEVIEVPYRSYVLGVCEKYSPWYQEFTSKIFKFSTLSLNKGEVHKALSVKSSSIYRIKLKNYDEAYYHLSRENADSMLERYLRYWRGERFSSEPLSVTSTWVIKKTIRYFLLNSIFFKGKAAIALAFSYLGYHMISYVYRWDYKYANADKIYSNIRENISNIWKRCD